jgi:hypothetical protein
VDQRRGQRIIPICSIAWPKSDPHISSPANPRGQADRDDEHDTAPQNDSRNLAVSNGATDARSTEPQGERHNRSRYRKRDEPATREREAKADTENDQHGPATSR